MDQALDMQQEGGQREWAVLYSLLLHLLWPISSSQGELRAFVSDMCVLSTAQGERLSSVRGHKPSTADNLGQVLLSICPQAQKLT